MPFVAQSISDDLWSTGLRPDEDVMIRRRRPPYIDKSLFYKSISQMFVPYVYSVKEKIRKPDKRALLLMDGIKGHCS
jgi:hypothetical protein